MGMVQIANKINDYILKEGEPGQRRLPLNFLYLNNYVTQPGHHKTGSNGPITLGSLRDIDKFFSYHYKSIYMFTESDVAMLRNVHKDIEPEHYAKDSSNDVFDRIYITNCVCENEITRKRLENLCKDSAHMVSDLKFSEITLELPIDENDNNVKYCANFIHNIIPYTARFVPHATNFYGHGPYKLTQKYVDEYVPLLAAISRVAYAEEGRNFHKVTMKDLHTGCQFKPGLNDYATRITFNNISEMDFKGNSGLNDEFGFIYTMSYLNGVWRLDCENLEIHHKKLESGKFANAWIEALEILEYRSFVMIHKSNKLADKLYRALKPKYKPDLLRQLIKESKLGKGGYTPDTIDNDMLEEFKQRVPEAECMEHVYPSGISFTANMLDDERYATLANYFVGVVFIFHIQGSLMNTSIGLGVKANALNNLANNYSNISGFMCMSGGMSVTKDCYDEYATHNEGETYSFIRDGLHEHLLVEPNELREIVRTAVNEAFKFYNHIIAEKLKLVEPYKTSIWDI